MARDAGDPVGQKRTLFDALALSTGADAWTWVLTRTPAPGDPASMPVLVLRLDGGLDEQQRTILVETQRSPHRRILAEALFPEVDRTGRATRRRADLIDDESWPASPYRDAVAKPMGLDEFLIAVRRLEGSLVSTLLLFRAVGRPGFDDAAVPLVELTLDRVHWLHHHGPIDLVADTLITLSPRERQVLRLVVAGDSQKQIAAKLGLSKHTVGGYQKVIYRHFKVASRGELQAKFVEGQTAQ